MLMQVTPLWVDDYQGALICLLLKIERLMSLKLVTQRIECTSSPKDIEFFSIMSDEMIFLKKHLVL